MTNRAAYPIDSARHLVVPSALRAQGSFGMAVHSSSAASVRREAWAGIVDAGDDGGLRKVPRRLADAWALSPRSRENLTTSSKATSRPSTPRRRTATSRSSSRRRPRRGGTAPDARLATARETGLF